MKKICLTIILFNLLSLTIHAQLDTLICFEEVAGANPYGSLINDGTYLYGMTSSGGNNHGNGLIFKIKPDGTDYTNLLNFNDTIGACPLGSLFYDGAYLYGVASAAGVNNNGTIFKIKPDGTGFAKLFDFNGINGASPRGSLISDGTYLYGTTAGNTNNHGNIFKIKPDGTGFDTLLQFTDTNGASASCTLYYDGVFLYGTTPYSANGMGAIFKIKPDGSGFTILYDFGSNVTLPNGAFPISSLISDGTYLYGMTTDGGAQGNGVIFKIKPDGSNFVKLFDFDTHLNGGTPKGALILNGNYLYGMTSQGGFNGMGVIFRIKTDGTNYFTLADFDGINGNTPYGDLSFEGSNFYGMTCFGRYYDHGGIFKFAESATDIAKHDLSNNSLHIYPNPAINILNVELKMFNGIAELKLFDVNGKLVLTQSIIDKTTIDVSDLNSGVYNLSLLCGDCVLNKRVIILR